MTPPQAPYGWAPPAGPWPPGGRVPGTVQAAAIVTWVCCALAALATVVLTAFAALIGTIVLPQFERADRVDMVLFVTGSAAAALVACAVASACAWFVWRRHRWARIALAVISVLALCACAVVLSPPTLVVVPGCVAVLVLLFLPQSNAWFRTRPAS